MLVHGTCNPVGEKNGYEGVYMSEEDLNEIVRTRALENKPVHMEHRGEVVGHVVSAWQYDGKLDVLVQLPSDDFGSCIAGSCVASGCLKDFSLGYKVGMSAWKANGPKRIVEVSLVKKGARNDCHIKNYVR